MSVWKWTLLIVLLLVLGAGGFVAYELTRLDVEQLSEDLHLVRGAGGNVAILNSSEGAVVVDSMTLKYQGKRLKDLAVSLTGKPVVMLINTHYHFDHTHGNPAFNPGTRVVATERTLHHLQVTDAEHFEGAEALLPGEVFTDTRRITLGDKNITLLHPGRGHTDGDLVVLFEEEALLHTGDLFFNKHYPFIDLEGGGSVDAWIKTLSRVLELPFERVIPGHGEVTDRQGLLQFQTFLKEAWDSVTLASASGMSLEALLETSELTSDAGYTEVKLVIGLGLDREFLLRTVWQEVHAEVEARP